jgi:hypothetical protein
VSDAAPTADTHRVALGFLTVEQTAGLGAAGIRVLDPGSTLVAARARLGDGTVLYPGVVLECDETSTIQLGRGAVLYPGCVLRALDDGSISTAAGVELGPGGVRLLARGTAIQLGPRVRLLDGCSLEGPSWLGDGAQVIGAVTARRIRLASGGAHDDPDPEERGAVLEGTGLAEGIELPRGAVRSLGRSFADAPAERQRAHQPPS